MPVVGLVKTVMLTSVFIKGRNCEISSSHGGRV
jgi:hypothetical protein